MATEVEKLEEEIVDLKNVEDDDVDNEDESTSEDLFTITSYGVDHNVDGLVKRLRSENYYIPDFQRQYVWSQNDASKFIESLLLGLPVPGVFLYKEGDGPKHLVIDGQQRLKSLQKFYDGLFGEKKFKLTGIKTKWKDLGYADLSEDDQLRLDDATIHATVFKQDTPSDNMDSVYEVFERINTGGLKLSPQEIRSCIAYGDFNTLLFSLNDNIKWREIFGKKSNRLKDVELILRLFAFRDRLAVYRRPMKKFLSDYMKDRRSLNKVEMQEVRAIWEDSILKIRSSLGSRPFRPSGRALNVAFYDSFTVALSLKLQKGGEVSDDSVRRAYDKLQQDTEYLGWISRSTADEEYVKNRFERAIKALGD